MGLLSIFVPRVIFEGGTKYNKEIKVIELGKTKKLIVDGIVQSFSSNSNFAKGKVWGKISDITFEECPHAKNVLILGMGAGTIAHLLRKKYKTLKLTCVEIDKVIVDLAKKHFEFKEDEDTKIIVGNALEVVTHPSVYGVNQKFECIIVDTYSGGEQGEEFSKLAFFESLTKLMDKGGLLIINKIVYKNQSAAEIDKYAKRLKQVVPTLNVKQIKYPSVADNYIYYGLTDI